MKKAKIILNPAAHDTRIEIDGIDVTPIVQAIDIQHEPGRMIPRVVLTTLALDGIEYEGPAEVLRETIGGIPYVPSDQELAAEMRRLGAELERRVGHPLFWTPPSAPRGPIEELGRNQSGGLGSFIGTHRPLNREELAARMKPLLDFLARQIERVRRRFSREGR